MCTFFYETLQILLVITVAKANHVWPLHYTANVFPSNYGKA